ncbi:ferredoxin-type protein NapG [Azospirillum thermophilum]|uniref:Ferredoxin-type protein NapG n=1 Tax=Azospirillum thermophilum TaxID=2202148 RepID=A0A2S2CYF2_9PROT|nr:ferredoxin-type protein NapG [Azospirillum thermophilum]AWK89543.1 ferredoxin-type protein NapG [Azospirillum thermophilum]
MPPPPNKDRRQFLADAAKLAAGAGCTALVLGELAGPSRSLAAPALRPPGALPEADFLGACVRCGLCARACPYDTLKLAEPGGPAAMGTPYFEARDIPCEMCPDIPCVPACPTGALDRSLTDIDKARMGTAVLVGHESCLNVLGLRCDVCYRVCPLIDKAITLEMRHNERTGKHAYLIPVVHTDACTGCGKCEKSCVLEEAAIKVLPTALAVGRIGGHYRLGWEEKAKHGGALIEGTIDLPDRGYEPPSLKSPLGKGGLP